MKIIIILFGVALLLILVNARAFKKISLFRLLIAVMLMIYSIGIIKMIFLFPMSSFLSLSAGMMAVLCMALLFRQRSTRPERKAAEPKIRMLNGRQHRLAIRNHGLEIKKEWRLSSH